MAVLGDHYPAVLAFQPVHDLREPVLDLRQRHLLTNRHSHKYSYFRRAAAFPQQSPGLSLRLGRLTSQTRAAQSPADAELPGAAMLDALNYVKGRWRTPSGPA